MSYYDTQIRQAQNFLKQQGITNDEKQKPVLQLYRATKMKILVELLKTRVDNITADSSSPATSPRGRKLSGGSRKRKIIHKKNRTHRK
jgi:hypothetical protein